jgi:hypothetical protein
VAAAVAEAEIDRRSRSLPLDLPVAMTRPDCLIARYEKEHIGRNFGCTPVAKAACVWEASVGWAARRTVR